MESRVKFTVGTKRVHPVMYYFVIIRRLNQLKMVQPLLTKEKFKPGPTENGPIVCDIEKKESGPINN